MEDTSIAIFAGGCFWELEENFSHTAGILSTRCGYTGGKIPHPSHMEIISGKSGHVHALEIIYYPKQISYNKLLDIFFSAHNPTLSYSSKPHFNSVIFYTTDEQQQQAFEKISYLEKTNQYSDPISTQIKKATTFYPATEFHQHYLQKKHIKNHNSFLP